MIMLSLSNKNKVFNKKQQWCLIHPGKEESLLPSSVTLERH